MKHLISITSVLIIFLLTPFTPSQAEEILLKNGAIISGRITGHESKEISISTANGNQILSKSDIVRVQYVPFTPEQKKEALEAHRKKKAAQAKERERIRQLKESKEREQREAELEEKIRKEKEEEAMQASKRASALREFVSNGQMEKPKDEPISYWDFAWRSMVLPGWGHFYLERPWFGLLYLGGTAAFIGTVVQTRNDALSAKKESYRDSELNFLFVIRPGILNNELRIAYGYYANAKAFTEYQHKVDRYNGALASLGTFYLVQLIHIIYNGFAWENGLLIVEQRRKDPGTINTYFSMMPEHLDQEKKPGVSFQGGLTVQF